MIWVVFGIILLFVAAAVYFAPASPYAPKFVRLSSASVLTALGLYSLFSTSYVYVPRDAVGHLTKIYGFSDLPTGKIIATGGEKGPQAEVLGPGFHFSPFVNIIYNYEEFPTVQIPQGFYGQIVARDGHPLPDGAYIAPSFPEKDAASMLDATFFLEHGGFRGPQETVLEPGTYRLNRYLFDVKFGPDPNNDGDQSDSTAATVIPAGFVGVVKSNIGYKTDCTEETAKATYEPGALSVNLVPRGCVGIWKETLLPGAYYLNHMAYQVTPADVRVQTWNYQGGYEKRFIDLTVDQSGKIIQSPRKEYQEVPKTAADRAVLVKIEGWDVPVELRVLAQNSAKTAPIVVGAVGGLTEVENRILTPTIRSIVRNISGKIIKVPARDKDGNPIPGQFMERPTRVLDLIENRESIEASLLTSMQAEGRKAGIDIKEVRLGEPAIPPELLVSRLREQLAGQLMQTYKREKDAQDQRIATEQARATADQQQTLVTAQINVAVAAQKEIERETLGRGERKYLENLAQGQKAQAQVLGEDRVAMLQSLDKVLTALQEKPELVSMINKLVPNILVTDGGNSLSGAAAIIGEAMKTAAPAAPAKP